MYKNKSDNGLNNICGMEIRAYRLSTSPKTSQRMLADMLQREGLDLDKNAIYRIENGKRFVTDIELKIISKVLNIDYEILLKG